MCEYCDCENNGYYVQKEELIYNMIPFGNKNLVLNVSIDNDSLAYSLGSGDYGFGYVLIDTVKINYCPMCGRRLKGEL